MLKSITTASWPTSMQENLCTTIKWDWDGLACSPDLNPAEHLQDRVGHVVRARVTNQPRMGRYPTSLTECDRAGDQHEDEVPGCSGSIWFYYKLLRSMLSVQVLICQVSSDFNHTIQQTAPNKTQQQNKLFGTGKGDLASFSWTQPTYSTLLRNP